MQLVHVIPIARGIVKESLSYFTKETPTAGSIVSVPIRGTATPALVERVERVRDAKAAVRELPYALQKMDSSRATQVFLPAFLEAAKSIAEYYAASTGAVLSSIVPKAILADPRKVKCEDVSSERASGRAFEKLLLQADRDERFSIYRSVIREAFARKESVYLCLPTINDVEQFASVSERGIGPYAFVFHSALSKSELIKRWKAVSAEGHPVLIIATGSFFGIPRRDIGSIILERESAEAYRSQSRPFVDTRVCAEYVARAIGARLILADTFLRVETLYEHEEGLAAELAPLRFRPLSSAKSLVIDTSKNTPTQKGAYNTLSRELEELIRKNRSDSEHLFIFAGRRGLASITVCCDCGAVVRGEKSDSPMTLHKTSKGNVFFDHRTGEIRTAAQRCKDCGSWRLTALGGGIELVEEQVRERFPETPVLRIDSDSVKKPSDAQSIADEFYETPGCILLGTEMALPYLMKPFEHAAVASIDSLLAVPHYNTETRMFALLLTIRSLAQETFLIQTRKVNQRVISLAISGNLLDFYREEIEVRRALSYPPFAIFITITIDGKRPAIDAQMEAVEEALTGYDVRIFSAYSSIRTGVLRSHALIKVSRESWPDAKLVERLKALPPRVVVRVDPGSIL
ncbi:hypothetical protein COU17_02180 [Candidatus Kaiserbacteria bacterium CG10_big_fil_rev_8_21_14_0_10_49_17]|uniref:Primosomal protein N' 3' DNA-binding domain-containing protein n=1 Tax=Candidatus Kaiserbacteria bacterium CG10_big_fil_rev_8_21_14_0_10_49_17 TaxID=1974609 RepID=A0A2M6WEA3_9BACT|nr:MAG: hypothetical protein COU17_02180 [Candidatus Kaiserbacteria bacterium CG10_big_fil_rev_8_21_14_0_10_49_17]